MRWCVVSLALILASCGSAPEKPPETPRTVAKADGAEKKKPRKKRKAKRRAATPARFPKRCANKKGECLPPSEWVDKLCNDLHPEVALHLFGPQTPWKRLYMVARAEPFNASGGVSLVGDPLRPGEEVIALRRRNDSGRIQVGDTAGYDVLRWNGACATIHDGDFSENEPAVVRHARIEWRRLELPLRLSLEAQPNIGEVYETRHSRCKGKSMGIVSASCEEYDTLLSEEIVRFVREGGKLPQPKKVP